MKFDLDGKLVVRPEVFQKIGGLSLRLGPAGVGMGEDATPGGADVVVQDPDGESTTLASGFVYNALAPTMSVSRRRVASRSNIDGDLRCGLFGWALVFFEGATVSGVAVSSPI
ncbi:MAG: hypothetical protein WAR24_17960 [Candidatus Acidiferrales bacterium]